MGASTYRWKEVEFYQSSKTLRQNLMSLHTPEITIALGEWKFKSIGQSFQGGLGPLARNYGVAI